MQCGRCSVWPGRLPVSPHVAQSPGSSTNGNAGRPRRIPAAQPRHTPPKYRLNGLAPSPSASAPELPALSGNGGQCGTAHAPPTYSPGGYWETTAERCQPATSSLGRRYVVFGRSTHHPERRQCYLNNGGRSCSVHIHSYITMNSHIQELSMSGVGMPPA